MDDFFRFSKKLGFWVFLVHPTVVLVLLSASVERFFVSRMRDFFPIGMATQFVIRTICCISTPTVMFVALLDFLIGSHVVFLRNMLF